MDLYRPQMQKLYYDAKKYPTYMDQLGIKYPTVHSPGTQPAESKGSAEGESGGSF